MGKLYLYLYFTQTFWYSPNYFYSRSTENKFLSSVENKKEIDSYVAVVKLAKTILLAPTREASFWQTVTKTNFKTNFKMTSVLS